MLKGLLFISLLIVLPFLSVCQQRYVVVEKIGGKRIRLVEGDEIHFKLKGEEALYNDYIMSFRDSTISISSGIKIHLKDVSDVYAPRRWGKSVRKTIEIFGISSALTIFSTVAASQNGLKDKRRLAAPFITGASFFTLAQLFRFVPNWKKYKMDKNGRIWIYQ